MTSAKQKGDAAERLAMKQLESDGWLVMKSPRKFLPIGPGRFVSKSNDYWGLFDLCCKKKCMTKWIQVKAGTRYHIYDKRQAMEDFALNFCNPIFESVEVWFKPDGTTRFEKFKTEYNPKMCSMEWGKYE